MNAPAELTDLDQWVTWNYQGAERRKVPYNARTGHAASSTDAETWSDFASACAAAERRHHAGVGFVFSD
jgi:putative DNA primase/helicase